MLIWVSQHQKHTQVRYLTQNGTKILVQVYDQFPVKFCRQWQSDWSKIHSGASSFPGCPETRAIERVQQ